MFKATRELIKARQPHTDYVVEKVFVKSIKGGIANKCFENACDYDENHPGSKTVSGWIVNKFDERTNSTAIIQHFWNITPDGDFIDSTPNIEEDVEYVIDTEITAFGQENYDYIDSCVCSSLLYQKNQFYLVDTIDYISTIKPVKLITNLALFQTAMQNNIED